MNLNEVRIAEDKDFEVLKIYLSRNDGWNLHFQKGQTAVWTRQAPESEFAMIRVSMILLFCAIEDQENSSETRTCAVILSRFTISLKTMNSHDYGLQNNRHFRK